MSSMTGSNGCPTLIYDGMTTFRLWTVGQLLVQIQDMGRDALETILNATPPDDTRRWIVAHVARNLQMIPARERSRCPKAKRTRGSIGKRDREEFDQKILLAVEPRVLVPICSGDDVGRIEEDGSLGKVERLHRLSESAARCEETLGEARRFSGKQERQAPQDRESSGVS